MWEAPGWGEYSGLSPLVGTHSQGAIARHNFTSVTSASNIHLQPDDGCKATPRVIIHVPHALYYLTSLSLLDLVYLLLAIMAK